MDCLRHCLPFLFSPVTNSDLETLLFDLEEQWQAPTTDDLADNLDLADIRKAVELATNSIDAAVSQLTARHGHILMRPHIAMAAVATTVDYYASTCSISKNEQLAQLTNAVYNAALDKCGRAGEAVDLGFDLDKLLQLEARLATRLGISAERVPQLVIDPHLYRLVNETLECGAYARLLFDWQPHYYENMLTAWEHGLQAIEAGNPLDFALIQSLHDECIGRGATNMAVDVANRLGGSVRFDSRPPADHQEQMLASWRADCHRLNELISETSNRSCDRLKPLKLRAAGDFWCFERAEVSSQAMKVAVERLLAEGIEQVSAASKDTAPTLALRTGQLLERLHPFVDGNLRLFIGMLPTLLMKRCKSPDSMPCVLGDPTQADTHLIEELAPLQPQYWLRGPAAEIRT